MYPKKKIENHKNMLEREERKKRKRREGDEGREWREEIKEERRGREKEIANHKITKLSLKKTKKQSLKKSLNCYSDIVFRGKCTLSPLIFF